MRRILSLTFLLCIGISAFAQYDDYIGAGHSDGITVTSSSDTGDATADKTIDGSGMDADLMEASRFLSQATFGANRQLIEDVNEIGFSTWIDNQFNEPATYMTPLFESIWNEIYDAYVNGGVPPDEIDGPWTNHWYYTWWQLNMTNDDLLRQRVAMALSEILVISINSDLRNRFDALGYYYDLLIEGAFGNYEDLLLDVTLSAPMGYYLSHLNNPKEIPEENIHPDENYAREIMQLFSIGLYELNNDGTQVLDGNGDPIPTYNNDDIKELAQVFTGLGPGDINDNVDWTTVPYFGLGFWGTDPTVPMIMYEEWHDTSDKELIGGLTLPAGQAGMTDITQAVSHLFQHNNVGPFLSKHLIKRLIKSNPTPAYVDRIASVFNDNGNGVRGDLQEVVKAILLDPEARDCAWVLDEESSKLREPIVRYLHLARSIPTDSPLNRYWNNGFDFLNATKQQILTSPTVFNFFPPEHQPVGEIADAGLVAPEFKLHNTATSVGFINRVNSWVVWDGLMYSWEDDDIIGETGVELNTLDLEVLAEEPEELINELDILLTHGQLTDAMRTIIRDAMTPFEWGNYNYDRTRMALYLLMISPDYNISK